jgi:uncharacterized protein YdeI (YjbR/CyaY-like superfamily)
MRKAASVDEYITSGGDWKESLILLREIFASAPLEETIKWGMPVYTLKGKNVAGFSAFKSWTGIWFYQGVFLKDIAGKLINAKEGLTKGLRQWRFSSADEIRSNTELILSYLEEAIQNQKEGKEIKAQRNKPIAIPEVLMLAFRNNPGLKDQFEALSLSKRRDYAEHIGSAKREETRQQRMEQAIPMILEGIGRNDKYSKNNS